MWNPRNSLHSNLVFDVQIEYEPSFQWLVRVEISGNMNMVVRRRPELRMELPSKHLLAECLSKSIMAPLGVTRYICNACVYYDSRWLIVHDG